MSKKNLDVFKGFQRTKVVSLDEACEEYAFNFDVEKRALKYEGSNGEELISPYHEQVVRADNSAPLGVVGLGYTIVPYRIAFSPAEELIVQGARIMGGTLANHGEIAYLYMRSPGEIKIGEGDVIYNDYILKSSHDGSAKIELRLTPYRTGNGTALTVDAVKPLAFKHTTKVTDRINRARACGKRIVEAWAEFETSVARMIATPVTEQEARDFIDLVLGGDKEKDSTRLANIKVDIYTLFKYTGVGTRHPRCRNTVFGLVEAFAEWADHHQTLRKSKKAKRDEDAAFLHSRLVADSAKKKQKAYAMACAMMKNRTLSSLTKGQ